MDTMKRILETRTKMILDLRYYARIAMMLKLELNEQIDTARTDGLSIQFNPKFADSLSDNELKQSLLMNQCMLRIYIILEDVAVIKKDGM